MTDKRREYTELVRNRKTCNECAGLTNASSCASGVLDGREIGPWTRWQGNLDACVMVVGQDWGDVASFIRLGGIDADTNATNLTLRVLLRSVGIDIPLPRERATSASPEVFLTNAILCLKSGGAQADVTDEWFETCGRRFLRPQIELVRPRVVVCLGERAFRSVMLCFGLSAGLFREAVESTALTWLSTGSTVVPVYHCGRRTLNTHRDLSAQLADWRRVAKALGNARDSA